jgi:hypothetical protein
MLKFITDIQNENEPDILTKVQHETLLILSIEGQYLGSYEPPEHGWTHEKLTSMAESFPSEWNFCGADALIGDQWVGSTEI